MAGNSNSNILDFLMGLVSNDQDSKNENTVDPQLYKFVHEEVEDVGDDLDDILEENIIQQEIKNLDSSDSESQNELNEVMGIKKNEPIHDNTEDVILLRSAIEKNRTMKRILESLECSLILQLRKITDSKEWNSVNNFNHSTKVNEHDFYSRFASPYFRDGSFPCPKNSDQRLKEKINRPVYEDVEVYDDWDDVELTLLEDAIRDNIVDTYLNQDQSNRTKSKKKLRGKNRDVLADKILRIRNHDLGQVLMENNVISIDWEAVSRRLHNPHSPYDCEVLWNLYLKPSINKTTWGKSESLELIRIAGTHSYKNWIKIANDLNTNRSGYLCFLHYQRKLAKSKFKWTREELTLFLKIVEACKIDKHINWSKVMYYFDFCDFNTLYCKYYKNITSAGKETRKGWFDNDEDKLIIHAVQKEKLTTRAISKMLPSRNTIQIRDRYFSLAQDRLTGGWTRDEDTKLIALVKEYGTGNWSKIAQRMENRTRVQIRQHYLHIINILKKNPNRNVDNYRQRTTSRKKKRLTKLFKETDVEGEQAKDIFKKDTEELELLKYFAHESKVLETKQSIISSFEKNGSNIIPLCKLLGFRNSSTVKINESGCKDWQECFSEAEKFINLHHNDIPANISLGSPITLVPPNLITAKTFRNIFVRLQDVKNYFKDIDELNIPHNDPSFKTALETWYKRLVVIFGSTLFVQDMSLLQYKQIFKNAHTSDPPSQSNLNN